MILIDLANWEEYANAYPNLRTALEWASSCSKDNFITHREELDNGAFANFERPAMLLRERVQLEAHRKYIDIHIPLHNDETIGWAPTQACHQISKPYDAEHDIIFFGDDAHSMIRVRVGDAAIFFPSDAHAPNIGIGYHKKICIKIPVE